MEAEREAERETFLQRYPTPGEFALAVAPHNTRQTPALEAIDAELTRVATGETDRLMIFCPPQEGKSTRTACWYPLWRLVANPSLRIAIVSYNQQKALRWGKWLRRMIEKHPEFGIQLEPGSRAGDRWETTAGGRVLAVGINGGITGEPVDELIIDDPIEGHAQAESKTYRDNAWGWWESNAMTRASGSFRVILMMTRWHADDLAGRLIKNEPGQWRVLRIPAIREEGTPIVRGHDGASVYNPDGELISVQDRVPGWFFKLREVRSNYVWRAVYAQNPVTAEGNLFRKADFRYWYAIRARREIVGDLGGLQIQLGQPEDGTPPEQRLVGDMKRFITIDLAASEKTSADWTVVAVWGITGDGLLILLDQDRRRMEEVGHFSMVRPLAERWAVREVYVERGFIGSTLVIDATKAGLRVVPLRPDKDKVTRAIPATERVRAHRVWFPAAADWLGDWITELAEFPTGRHDDRVDVLAYAARVMAAHWVEPRVLPTPRTEGRRLSPTEAAYESNVGTGALPDLSTAAW